MAHSIAQELVMTQGFTLEEAEAKVCEMRESITEENDAAQVLFDNGLDDDNGTWLAELSE